MFYERDTVLKDMRQYVIETNINGNNVRRLTLREDLLPKNYVQEKHLEEDFHSKNKDFIAAYDVRNNQWVTVDVKTIKYVQVIDGY